MPKEAFMKFLIYGVIGGIVMAAIVTPLAVKAGVITE